MSIPYVNMIIMTVEQSFALLYIPDLFIAAYRPLCLSYNNNPLSTDSGTCMSSVNEPLLVDGASFLIAVV